MDTWLQYYSKHDSGSRSLGRVRAFRRYNTWIISGGAYRRICQRIRENNHEGDLGLAFIGAEEYINEAVYLVTYMKTEPGVYREDVAEIGRIESVY